MIMLQVVQFLGQKFDGMKKEKRIVASLWLKNEIGERQDSLRRLGWACASMLIASSKQEEFTWLVSLYEPGRIFYEVFTLFQVINYTFLYVTSFDHV